MTFTPTRAPDGYPTACFCCARHAHGVGIGDPSRGDPRYLCQECSLIMQQIKTIRSFNGFERAAVDYAIEHMCGFIETHGADLAEWDAETVTEFVKETWVACGDGVRAAVRDGVPF